MAAQTLVFVLDDTGTSGATLSLTATSQDAAGVDIAAGLPAVAYTSNAPDVAEVRGGELVLLMDGTATITASRGGGTVAGVTYGAATAVTEDITVGVAAQTLVFVLDDTGTSGATLSLTATSQDAAGVDIAAGLPAVAYTSNAPDVAEVRGGELVLLMDGTATITASRGGGTVAGVTYGAATAVTEDITVGVAAQTLVFVLDDTGTSGATLSLTATSQDAAGVDIAAGLPAVTYTSNAPDVAEVRGGELVLLMDGTATITASRGGGTVAGVTYGAATAVTEEITVGVAAQTLVFVLDDTGTSGAALALTATSQDADGNDIAAGLPAVTYVSDAPDVAEVRGGQLVLLMDGTATITAMREGGTAGGVTYGAATAVTEDITVGVVAQTLVFVLDDTGTSGATLSLTATSQDAAGVDIAAGLPAVTYTSNAPDVAEVRGGELVLLMDGTATITASRGGGTAGGVTYGAATAVTEDITVGVAAQTLVFVLDDTGTSGATLALTATSQDAAGVDIAAGLPAVTYTSNAPDVAEVRGGELVLLMDGTATITAMREGGTAGGVTYGAATAVTEDITVGVAAQTLVFVLDDTGTSGATLALTATSQDAAGVDIAAGLPAVTYTSNAPDVAEVRGGELVLLMDGTATITASRGGGTVAGVTYGAATAVTEDITVGVAAQTLVFVLDDTGTSGATLSLTTTSQDADGNDIAAGLPAVTYVSDAPDVAEVRGGELVLLMDGTATITASRGGGTVAGVTYGAATAVTEEITVGVAAQTLVFVLDDTGTSGATLSLTTTSQDAAGVDIAAGLPAVAYTSNAPGVAMVRNVPGGGQELVLLMDGTATITASRGGGTVAGVTYGVATAVTEEIMVSAATQTLSFTLADGTSGNTLALTATSQDADGNNIAAGLPAITYISSDERVAEVRVAGGGGQELLLKTPGTATITASRGEGVAEGVTYAAATDVTQDIMVNAATQTIMFTNPANNVTRTSGDNITLMATSQDAGGNPTSLPVEFMIVEERPAGTPAVAGTVATLDARTGVLTLLKPGIAIITASQAGGTVVGGVTTYGAATDVTRTITVMLAGQTLTFTLQLSGTSGDLIPLGATTDTPGAATLLSYSSDFTDRAEVVGNPDGTFSLKLKKPGMATITAQAGGTVGNVTYEAGEVERAITVAAVTQTISFTPPASGVAGNTIPLTATGGASGMSVMLAIAEEFGPDGTPVAPGTVATLVVGTGVLTLVGEGRVEITASQMGGDIGDITYAPADDVTESIMVAAADAQTLVFMLDDVGVSGQTIDLTVTSQDADGNEIIADGLPDATYVSDNTSVAEVLGLIGGGQEILLKAPGTAIITASREKGTAGGVTYAAAADVTQEIEVTEATQVIEFTSDAEGRIGNTITLTARGGTSGNPIAFRITGEFEPDGITPATSGAVATLSGNMLTLNERGTVEITATQIGGEVRGTFYTSAIATQIITVNGPTQLITFTTPADGSTVNFGDDPVALSATTDAVGLFVSFAITTTPATGVATLTDDGTGDGMGLITLDGAAGTIEITASQDGNAIYEEATAVMHTITVTTNPAQVIKFNSAATGTVGSTITLAATATSGLPVTFAIESQAPTSGTGDVATLDGDGVTLTLATPGTVTITATQAGGEVGGITYAASTAIQTITVIPTPPASVTAQVIAFTSVATGVVGETIPLMATATSGLDVTFIIASETPTTARDDVAELTADNMLRLISPGTVVITARQGGGEAGGTTYAPATAIQTITIIPTPPAGATTQIIAFTSVATGVVGETIPLMAMATSGLDVTFIIASETPTTAGEDVAELTVDNMLRLINPGRVVITASQLGGEAGGITYAAATAIQTITIIPTPPAGATEQVIAFSSVATGVVNETIPLMATATSGLDVTFIIASETPTTAGEDVAELTAGNMLRLISPGRVVITATQLGGEAGGITYAAATAIQTITVILYLPAGTTEQTIAFSSADTGVINETISLIAAATSGLDVTFIIASETPTTAGDNVAELPVGSNMLRLIRPGTVVITARQAGGESGGTTYAAATAVQTITVSKQAQAITFSTPSGDESGTVGNTINLAAMTNAPGLFVSFSIDPATGVATLTDAGDGTGSLLLDDVGTLTVTASQTGNAEFAAATPVMRTITVSPVVLGIEEDTDDFVLYPNPTSGKLYFSERVEQFRLYSVEGRLLETQENVRLADLTALPSGLYFVEVVRNGWNTRYRILKE